MVAEAAALAPALPGARIELCSPCRRRELNATTGQETVPVTSTCRLTNATMPHVARLAEHGVGRAGRATRPS